MAKSAPKRIASIIMNALKGGVVPRVGLEYIAVGRTPEIHALLHDISVIEDGGAAFRFIVGKYGSGKSFLLQTMRNYAMEKGFVAVDADLSPERRLTGSGGQGLATYKELIQSMSTKTKPDGGALPLILEKWISTIQSEVAADPGIPHQGPEFTKEVYRRIYTVVNDLEGMVNGFDFARVIILYWEACVAGDDIRRSKAIQWFRGEYSTKTEAKRELGINVIVTDDSWYDFIKVFAVFLVRAGYKGMLVLVDELVNIYKIPNSITRQYNYEKILTMYNDILQGKARYFGILMSGTPQSIEDRHKGIFSYEALRSRLSEGRFATDGMKDLLAPVIRLEALSNEEMYVLIEKLALMHSQLFDYEQTITHDELVDFLKIEYERIGADTKITPREVIRDFIEMLNICYQNAGKSVAEVIGSSSFVFSQNNITDEKIHAEFADFEV